MRRLLDSALFWTTFGGVLVVAGGVFVGVGANDASTAHAHTNVWSEGPFVGGVAAMGVGVLMLIWALGLFIAHGYLRRHGANAAPGGFAPVKRPRMRRRERRLDLIDHHRVGEELLAEGEISEAVAQVWTESVHAFVRTRSLGRRWFATADIERFLRAGTGTNRSRMQARLDVLNEIIEKLRRRRSIPRPNWRLPSDWRVSRLAVALWPFTVQVDRDEARAAQTEALRAVGIVVQSATWGDPANREGRMEVTQILNSLVANSRLRCPVENATFGIVRQDQDPAYGVIKTLEVVYRNTDDLKIQQATFTEHDTVDLP